MISASQSIRKLCNVADSQIEQIKKFHHTIRVHFAKCLAISQNGYL